MSEPAALPLRQPDGAPVRLLTPSRQPDADSGTPRQDGQAPLLRRELTTVHDHSREAPADGHDHPHDHGHGHHHGPAHDHAKPHHHHEHPLAPRADPPRLSLMALSAAQRILLAAPVISLLWLLTLWAMQDG